MTADLIKKLDIRLPIIQAPMAGVSTPELAAAVSDADALGDAGWLEILAPHFKRFGQEPPAGLKEIYKSFNQNEAMLELLLAEHPAVVSFHFGLPPAEYISALKTAVIATVTNLEEARLIETAGMDAVIAQGYEAGGHRGVFDEDAPDDQLGTLTLTRLLVEKNDLPVISAGGIMDGSGIAAAHRRRSLERLLSRVLNRQPTKDTGKLCKAKLPCTRL